ncbi:hypothetical protein [Nostoc sp. CHAB 5715]|uniref:hypothetical protein n=1 Tax=Nostoc sp. CHAB 5715 TaxID=2780400 RepID=UPI001E658B1A|nr:hypothetical protein [Nostoc sp. CHAB 5715]
MDTGKGRSRGDEGNEGDEEDEGDKGEFTPLSPIPHDGSCSTWGDPKTALPPPCPMPNAQFSSLMLKFQTCCRI